MVGNKAIRGWGIDIMVREKEKLWYVLHTRSKFEKVVCEGLVRKGQEVFLPTVTTRSVRRDRKVFLQRPLFPGYLFVKTGNFPAQRVEVLKTAGAVRFIGNQQAPLPVDEDIIDSLKIIVAADSQVKTGACFRRGQPVRVVYGPLAGVTGVFVRHLGSARVAVNIDAMGQSAAVHVAAEDIEPLAAKNIMVS